MQKIVIDTNVIVSSLIGRGSPKTIIYDIVFGRRVQIFISKETFSEYVIVLNRPRFKKYPEFILNAEIVLNKIEQLAISIKPTSKLNIIKDEPDNRFLELAVSSEADFLITGNTNDFTFSEYGSLKITTPEKFLSKYFKE